MNRHPLEDLIDGADAAINREDFEALMAVYAEDAILVVKPGRIAIGKAQIREAFEAIAAHFRHGVDVKQTGMKILEAGDTALVLARTVVTAPDQPPTERRATYVFRKDPGGKWLCVIDNSYGHALLSQPDV